MSVSRLHEAEIAVAPAVVSSAARVPVTAVTVTRPGAASSTTSLAGEPMAASTFASATARALSATAMVLPAATLATLV